MVDNEEEIIIRYKQILNLIYVRGFIKDINGEITDALKKFYFLYKDEKEKNKKLKEMIERRIDYTSKLEKDLFENCGNYVVSKDKIRAKLKELEKIRECFTNSTGMTEISTSIDTLQDLLEEE